MEVGATTSRLAALKASNYLANFVGPLGVPTHIEKFGTVAGGVGVAPIARALYSVPQAQLHHGLSGGSGYSRVRQCLARQKHA